MPLKLQDISTAYHVVMISGSKESDTNQQHSEKATSSDSGTTRKNKAVKPKGKTRQRVKNTAEPPTFTTKLTTPIEEIIEETLQEEETSPEQTKKEKPKKKSPKKDLLEEENPEDLLGYSFFKSKSEKLDQYKQEQPKEQPKSAPKKKQEKQSNLNPTPITEEFGSSFFPVREKGRKSRPDKFILEKQNSEEAIKEVIQQGIIKKSDLSRPSIIDHYKQRARSGSPIRKELPEVALPVHQSLSVNRIDKVENTWPKTEPKESKKVTQGISFANIVTNKIRDIVTTKFEPASNLEKEHSSSIEVLSTNSENRDRLEDLQVSGNSDFINTTLIANGFKKFEESPIENETINESEVFGLDQNFEKNKTPLTNFDQQDYSDKIDIRFDSGDNLEYIDNYFKNSVVATNGNLNQDFEVWKNNSEVNYHINDYLNAYSENKPKNNTELFLDEEKQFIQKTSEVENLPVEPVIVGQALVDNFNQYPSNGLKEERFEDETVHLSNVTAANVETFEVIDSKEINTAIKATEELLSEIDNHISSKDNFEVLESDVFENKTSAFLASEVQNSGVVNALGKVFETNTVDNIDTLFINKNHQEIIESQVVPIENQVSHQEPQILFEPDLEAKLIELQQQIQNVDNILSHRDTETKFTTEVKSKIETSATDLNAANINLSQKKTDSEADTLLYDIESQIVNPEEFELSVVNLVPEIITSETKINAENFQQNHAVNTDLAVGSDGNDQISNLIPVEEPLVVKKAAYITTDNEENIQAQNFSLEDHIIQKTDWTESSSKQNKPEQSHICEKKLDLPKNLETQILEADIQSASCAEKQLNLEEKKQESKTEDLNEKPILNGEIHSSFNAKTEIKPEEEVKHLDCFKMTQIRVLTLNDKEHQESTIYRIEKNWVLQFRLGPSLLGRQIKLYCNYPVEGNEFERGTYQLLTWFQDEGCKNADDTALSTQITAKISGSFHYYFVYDNENSEERQGSGYFLVDPALKFGNGEDLPLDSIQCQTVLAKHLGFSGTGKSCVWKCLNRTYANQKLKPFYNDLNPKAVTNDELFGVINPATREWKDGLFSVIMRDQTNLTGEGPKWIVLDGDIDPMWIESLNTLMDDNKVLTLASNERIALTRSMRLLFEIANLRTATPATVSRAGILYINPADLGWNPFIASWIDTRTVQSEKANLMILFDKYVPPCLEVVHRKVKKITPISDIAHLQMLVSLLDCFLTPQNVPLDCPKEWYEIYFAFSVAWAFGSALFQDQIVDWRNDFSKWFTNEFRAVKFPVLGNIFQYYIDPETKRFLPWTDLVPEFELDMDIPLQATLVNTAETSRLRFFVDLLVGMKIPVMLVGPAGSGKSVTVQEKLNSLADSYAVTDVPFNFYTTSEMLQRILEKPLEKKAGKVYAPPGNKTMIYFIDDMNMPEVDKYFTVQPHTLLKQWMDYQHWYDRQKLSLKEIHNVQFISCMNPSAGSFTIDPRLQRHFCVFAVSYPSEEASLHIYNAIFSQHLSSTQTRFNPSVQKLCPTLVQAAYALHSKVGQTFLPTAVKFHYTFTLRDLSNIFQGMLFTTGAAVQNQTSLIRLWIHEACRVYGDKLVEKRDLDTFNKLIIETVKKGFEEIDENATFEKPLIFCHFAEGFGDPKYFEILEFQQLTRLLNDALSGYNDLVAAMNLVLFEDAMYHICRINRILEAPRGNALLVGVGGFGKQSLTRLAAFISSFEVFQIQLKKGYSMNDMKLDIASLYMKAGLKSVGIVFLVTDAQVSDESYLVLINDVLASGEISELLPDEDVENVIGAVRAEVKTQGLQDTRENCWKFFIDRVRRLLKIVLCFSPVGSTLRVRARKFPALVNCTSIDWFHDWPKEALESVSAQFLAEIKVLPPELIKSVSLFMSNAHAVVNEFSEIYLLNEKRYNYTTPKSFLEQIDLYNKLLTAKNEDLQNSIVRLQNGLTKLSSTSEEVDGLKEVLAVQEIELGEKNAAASALIEVLTKENEKVATEQAVASEEEKKVTLIEEDVSVKAKICADDLAKAEPALLAAQAALNTLNKNNLTELKSFGSPPEAVVSVCAAVLVLFSSKGKIPKSREWKDCKVMMGKVDDFLNNLINYDKENMSPEVVKVAREYTKDPDFIPEKISSKSLAAAGLCAWVINILKFYDVFVVVEPKRRALQQANKELNDARNTLTTLKEMLEELENQLGILRADFEEATNAKLKCQAEADATATMIDLANRLVNGLASENIRWHQLIKDYTAAMITLPGDILLVTVFLSYLGCFTKKYRTDIIDKHWRPYFKKLEVPIPMTEQLDPLSMLTNDAKIAQWNNEGLPTDRMSTENACILTNSARWPLMIDPQLQGIKWIKTKYGDALEVVRVAQKNYLDVIEKSIEDGKMILIENIGETLDAVLNPVLGRVLIKKGKCIKMGDKEIDYNPKFRLILHTKLANPHYKPEIQAQTTLINFTVTRDGLEEQLLAEVVKVERPDLESLKSSLTKQQNDFKITLKTCEDNLLYKLSSATGNILGDVELVLNLETTKKTANEIAVKVEEAKITSVKIDEAREQYRPCAARASLLYFILNDLFKINAIYQFSLKAFSVVFKDALKRTKTAENLKERVFNLLDSITFSVFMYTSRGLFECDKLIFMAQMTFQIFIQLGEVAPDELDFLLRFPSIANLYSPVDFLNNICWGGIKALSTSDEFKGLDKDLEGSAKRWRKFVESECPENEKFPGEWKNKTTLQKLCIMRCLRPDRMTYAVRLYIEEKMGSKYINARSVPFEKSYEETSNQTPVFFFLSPGVNPLKDVEKMGKKLGFTFDNGNFHSVSLGQGQEIVAEDAMDLAAKDGQWVILQNIHLVVKWLASLEKKMEHCMEGHENYRLYLSAEPNSNPHICVIPQGILESSIKITNEPPTGMYANLHKALDNFNQETLEMSSREAEFKAILFSLCYFHAVVAERRKFGPQGWNRNYPFNVGDLTISVSVLYNYLENNNKVPWEDLRYLFGEIMYGGHITDDWDRRLCKSYLLNYMQPELLEGDLQYAPGFFAPPNTDYLGYHKYIDDRLPPESPYLYGLHPNAEIGFLASTSETMFRTIFEMQPRDSAAAAGAGMSKEDKVRNALEEIYDKLTEEFPVAEMMAKVEERTPYIIVAFQECERMNMLTKEMKRSLIELDLGLKGELTITSVMETLQDCLFLDTVPDSWSLKAYPSLLPLGQWVGDLTLRIKELEGWITDFSMPPTVWLGGFFNPQSFLTAIMQQTARKNEWPLDKMCLMTDVTKKQKDDFTSAPREGSYVHGLYMEGARWDTQLNSIADSRLKELFPVVPVVFIKAITQDKQDLRNMYDCPVYKTRMRGPTFVWTFNLKTKEKPLKWTLAGVAILLQV